MAFHPYSKIVYFASNNFKGFMAIRISYWVWCKLCPPENGGFFYVNNARSRYLYKEPILGTWEVKYFEVGVALAELCKGFKMLWIEISALHN